MEPCFFCFCFGALNKADAVAVCTVWVSPLVIKELKRIVESSEITKCALSISVSFYSD